MRDRVHKAPRDKYVRLTITINFSSTIRSLTRLRPPNHNHKGKQFIRGTSEWERLKVLRKKISFDSYFSDLYIPFFFWGLMLLFSSFSLLILWIILGFSFLSSYFFFSLQPFYCSFCWKVELQLLLKTVSISNRKNLGILE